jgi:hypothetical protein
MKLRSLFLIALFSVLAFAGSANAQTGTAPTLSNCQQPTITEQGVVVNGVTKRLYCSSESLVEQLTDAATNTGNDLDTAYTFALNGDAPDAAIWINQAITDIAPILSQSVIPPRAKPAPATK